MARAFDLAQLETGLTELLLFGKGLLAGYHLALLDLQLLLELLFVLIIDVVNCDLGLLAEVVPLLKDVLPKSWLIQQ